MQRQAGNAAVTGLVSAVQRWTGPISFQSQPELLAETRNGSYNALIQLEEATIATASDDERMQWVDRITASTLVVARASRALERIWRSFGTRFLQVAGTPDNLRRWRTSCIRHTGLPDQVPAAASLQNALLTDVRAVAGEYLQINREFVTSEMTRLGIPEAGEAAAAPNEAQTAELNRIQSAADSLAALRWGQQTATQIYVGYVDHLPGSGVIEDAHHYRRVRFDPPAPAPLTRIVRDHLPAYLYDEAAETEHRIGDGEDPNTLAPVHPYQDVRARYDQAESAANAVLVLFPELHAFSGGQEAAQLGRLAAATDPGTARRLLGEALRGMVGRIDSTVGRIPPGGGLDPLDLTPIHARLMDGRATGTSGTDWTQPFAQEVLRNMVQGHNVNRALRQLVLQYLAQLAFLVAPLPKLGPVGSAVATGVGASLTGVNVAIDASRYAALADAAAAGARPGTALVNRQSVDLAQMTVESEAIALAIGVLAFGAAAALAAVRRLRGQRPPPPEPRRDQPPQPQGQAPPGQTPQGQTPPEPAPPGPVPDAAAAAAAARTQAARAAFAADLGIEVEVLAGFDEAQIARLRATMPDTHPFRIRGMANYLRDQAGRGRHSVNTLRTLEEKTPQQRMAFFNERAALRWNPDWRGRTPRPQLQNGNLEEGWTHVEARHVTGTHPDGPGDLFAPGTTRQQLFEAAIEVIESGRRVSPRGRMICTFEKSMYVNGRRDAIQVTVDSSDGRIITVFPARSR